jgi:hypothetical protein
MPIDAPKGRRPRDFKPRTSSDRPVVEAPLDSRPSPPVPPPAPHEVARPPRAVNARMEAELVDAWDARLTALALPRGAAIAAALRALLDRDDDDLRSAVTEELVRQKQDQIRRRRPIT